MKLANLEILILGNWDYAGCGHFLAQAINTYTSHHATSMRLYPSTFGFESDHTNPPVDVLRDAWKRADIIHIHDDWTNIPECLMVKPTVITYHGTLYRGNPTKYNAFSKEMKWIPTVSTLDLTLTGPRWLPDTRPDLTQYINRDKDFRVCHAPSNRKRKGTDKVITACQGINLDLIENISWSKAMERKGHAWVTIDQFTYGYGCNSHEAWAMKQPTISGATNKAVLDLIVKAGGGHLPFVLVSHEVNEIRKAIVSLQNPAYYSEMAKAGHAYFVKNHSQKAVCSMALSYYNEALDLQYSSWQPRKESFGKKEPRQKSKSTVVISDACAMLACVGRNVGRESIVGPVTGKLYTYTGGIPFAVDRRDYLAMLKLTVKKRSTRKDRKSTNQVVFIPAKG